MENNRIREVSASDGTISTVVGNGSEDYSGDGGPGSNATLDRPSGIALDASGGLYISDFFNTRIRKVVLSTGIITTVTGNGNPVLLREQAWPED